MAQTRHTADDAVHKWLLPNQVWKTVVQLLSTPCIFRIIWQRCIWLFLRQQTDNSAKTRNEAVTRTKRATQIAASKTKNSISEQPISSMICIKDNCVKNRLVHRHPHFAKSIKVRSCSIMAEKATDAESGLWH